MLTLETMLKATRQMLSYGELKAGALDFLPARMTGYRDERREETLSGPASAAATGFVRHWDQEKGAFVYKRKD